MSSTLLLFCASILAVALSTTLSNLQIAHNYPDFNNYSYVQLQCLDDSEVAVPGASFQLNGTDIVENVEESEIYFTVTQDNEGFFTCSSMGVTSSNSAGLAAQPQTDYTNQTRNETVELSDDQDTILQILTCDIQPGALRERYSVEWFSSLTGFDFVTAGYTFNLTVNVSYSENSSLYYECRVTIDHDGEGTTNVYEGPLIIIRTIISGAPTILSAVELLLVFLFAMILTTIPTVLITVLCAWIRKFKIQQQGLYSLQTFSENELPVCEDFTISGITQSDTEFSVPLGNPTEILSEHDPIVENVSSPTPCSGPVIDQHNTRYYLPSWFTPVASLQDCTHDGRTYYNEENEFGLEIPADAIPEGVTVSIDIGVALYGPFQFPPGMRPVSPVFWICIRHLGFSQFLKPVTITLPHFLIIKTSEDIDLLGLTFLKAQHEMNDFQLYEFQHQEGRVYFEPNNNTGVFQTTHFCSLCIGSKDIMEAIKKAKFCISAVIPQILSVEKSSYATFYVTFLLKTCLKKLNEKIQDTSDAGDGKIEKYEFMFQEEVGVLEMCRPDSLPGKWIFGERPKQKISVRDIDFFVGNADMEEDLKTMEDHDMYPPRFCVVIDCLPPASPLPARFKFIGATEELVFDVVLRPKPPTPQYISGASPQFSDLHNQEGQGRATGGSILSADSSGFGQDELGITDMFDAKSKLMPVVGKWKSIGLALRLDYDKLNAIEKNNQSDINNCLTEMLALWLNKTDDKPTWGKLSKAVRHPAGGNNSAVADKVFDDQVSFL